MVIYPPCCINVALLLRNSAAIAFSLLHKYEYTHHVERRCCYVHPSVWRPPWRPPSAPQLTGRTHHRWPLPPLGVLHLHGLRPQPHDERPLLVRGHHVLWEARQRAPPRQSIVPPSHRVRPPVSRLLCPRPPASHPPPHPLQTEERCWSAWSSTSSDLWPPPL